MTKRKPPVTECPMCGFTVGEYFLLGRANRMAYHWFNCIGESFGQVVRNGRATHVRCPCGCEVTYTERAWTSHLQESGVINAVIFGLKLRLLGVQTKEE